SKDDDSTAVDGDFAAMLSGMAAVVTPAASLIAATTVPAGGAEASSQVAQPGDLEADFPVAASVSNPRAALAYSRYGASPERDFAFDPSDKFAPASIDQIASPKDPVPQPFEPAADTAVIPQPMSQYETPSPANIADLLPEQHLPSPANNAVQFES